ncbi:MAG: thioredoxin family protein [Melioribacteraceae bacterium]|nr:thioredoxin family protein [Melioribacteraceae bacterium]MCF8393296.1 thioredoxin family protein [Melioribacteraceae bacterium]MCF8419148.1 thioredoxin family protein [Melioribacteraceae bacterium]
MNITLLIASHCNACIRATAQLKTIEEEYPQINSEVININLYRDEKIFITPAWIINGELFAYGDINKEKLLAKLR